MDFKPSGKTIDGKDVFTGCFKFVGTYGLPLEFVIEQLNSRDIIIDWVDYILCALKDGHKKRTIRGRIFEAITDVFGKKYSTEFLIRLDKVLEEM